LTGAGAPTTIGLMEGAGLQDARGCLTPAGLTLLRAAAPGRAPQALALHLASCSRCQERMLAADAGVVQAPGRSTRRTPPPLWRTLLLFAAGLLLAALGFGWAARLLGGAR
jgi:hypothetical protein